MIPFQYSENNLIKIFHKGPIELTGGIIDPNFFGKGILTARDRNQLTYKCCMFYINPSDIRSDTDWMFHQSGVLYEAHVPLESIYPFNSDPLGFADGVMGIGWQLNAVYKGCLTKGFIGLAAKWMETYRVDCWQPIKPVRTLVAGVDY